MKNSHLEKMTIKELRTLSMRIERTIAARQHRERAALKDKLKALAEESGFHIAELFGSKTGKGRKPVAAKYADPTNPSLTWTGRGRMPLWLAAKVKAGQNKDKFLIR
jgi:DNA-binding protein H-NS